MSAGGSTSSTDTSFTRKGSVKTDSWRDVTEGQWGLMNKALGSTAPQGDNDAVPGVLMNKMQRRTDQYPYIDQLQNVINHNQPNAVAYGNNSLQSQAAVDPYSGSYETNSFGKYADEVRRAMGSARSGPAATRGGTAAQGFMMSDAVNQLGLNRAQVLAQNRQTDAGIQQSAASQLASQHGQRSQTSTQAMSVGSGNFYNLLNDQQNAAQLSSERAKMFSDLVPTVVSLTSKMRGKEENNLYGKGSQSASALSAGFNLCCFIFLEAYNGELPESVRRYRDMAAPESSARREGYISMSRWLVPAMRVSQMARTLTNCLLVKPLTQYGEWYYGKNKTGWVFWPVKQVWFKIWELTK